MNQQCECGHDKDDHDFFTKQHGPKYLPVTICMCGGLTHGGKRCKCSTYKEDI